MPDSEVSAAVDVAKEIARTNHTEHIRTLPSGVQVRITPVSTALLDEVTSRIKDPDVPMWRNDAKGRDEPNPDDPKYIAQLADQNRKRGIAIMDAMVMFGVELIDGLPSDNTWLTKLQFMAKRGYVNLEGYDLNDDLDLEFLFKRFVAVDTETLAAIGELSALTQEDVERAEDAFKSNKKR